MLIDGPSPKTPQPDTQLGTGSAAALALGQLNDVETIPHDTLDPERLRSILQRLDTGFYDAPDVRDQIAAKIGADLP